MRGYVILAIKAWRGLGARLCNISPIGINLWCITYTVKAVMITYDFVMSS